MGSWRFLLTRRWIGFAIIVALLAYLAWWLGEWQFGRLDERRAANAIAERNLHADPVPVESVMSIDHALTAEQEWTRIQATGVYDTEETVTVRYATRDGELGVDVVVPLVTRSGVAVLVDRGWYATETGQADPAAAPAPPAGTVTVVGWVRADATGDSTQVTDHSTRAVSSRTISAVIDTPSYRGFVDLDSEDPPPTKELVAPELPDLGEGPHFFYGLQWWFFGLLAIGGFGKLAYDEWRRDLDPATDSDSDAEVVAGDDSVRPD